MTSHTSSTPALRSYELSLDPVHTWRFYVLKLRLVGTPRVTAKKLKAIRQALQQNKKLLQHLGIRDVVPHRQDRHQLVFLTRKPAASGKAWTTFRDELYGQLDPIIQTAIRAEDDYLALLEMNGSPTEQPSTTIHPTTAPPRKAKSLRRENQVQRKQLHRSVRRHRAQERNRAEQQHRYFLDLFTTGDLDVTSVIA